MTSFFLLVTNFTIFVLFVDLILRFGRIISASVLNEIQLLYRYE